MARRFVLEEDFLDITKHLLKLKIHSVSKYDETGLEVIEQQSLPFRAIHRYSHTVAQT